MKLVILAGGYGTRLAEETKLKPKPLVKIGNKPIIWHIMKFYSYYGINNFIICLGYKGDVLVKELNKFTLKESWKVKYVQTGLKTMTGGRVKKIEKYIHNDKKIATLTAVKYKHHKGIFKFGKTSIVKKIKEKPVEYINGGFFVLSNKIFQYLKNSKTVFEKDSLPKLSKKNQLIAFKHNGFWACMDTVREKKELNKIYKSKQTAWKVWI